MLGFGELSEFKALLSGSVFKALGLAGLGF